MATYKITQKLKRIKVKSKDWARGLELIAVQISKAMDMLNVTTIELVVNSQKPAILMKHE